MDNVVVLLDQRLELFAATFPGEEDQDTFLCVKRLYQERLIRDDQLPLRLHQVA